MVFVPSGDGISLANHKSSEISIIQGKAETVATENDDFLARVIAMADELGLDGDKKDEYIGQHLGKKGGYKKVTTWVPDDKTGDKGQRQGSWF